MKRVALILLALCASLNAATYYVKPTGNDTNSGLTEALAWQHVQKGLTTAVAGDTVFIRAGTYDEASSATTSIWGLTVNAGFYSTHSGTAGDYIVYKGYPGDALPIIKGKSLSSGYSSTFRPAASFKDGSSYIIYDSLHFHTGYSGIHFTGDGADIHDIIIRNCIIDSTLGHDPSDGATDDDNSGGILAYYDGYNGGLSDGHTALRNLTVEGCTIFDNGNWDNGVANYHMGNSSGLHMYGCDSCLVRNNVIYSQVCGIHFKHSARYTEVYGNVIHDCEAAMWDRHSGSYPGAGYDGTKFVGSRWHHNVAYDVQACLYIGIGSTLSTIKDSLTYFYNNTCDCDSGSGGWNASFVAYGGVVSEWGLMNRDYFFNNIFAFPPTAGYGGDDDIHGAFAFANKTYSATNIYEDYNLHYGRGSGGNYYHVGSTSYSISSWQSGSPSGMLGGSGTGSSGAQGDSSRYGDPAFVNRAARDYHLQAGSTAASRGKGGSFTFFPGSSREETITLPTYFGAYAPTGACADTLVAPTFTSPANGATVSLNQVYLDWGDSTQAGTVDTYDLQVDDNSDFGSTVFTSATPWSKDTVTTTLKPYGTYYWRVRGRSDCDTSAWSGYRTFVQGDSCIQITGKGSLGSSDTCYCIVDSLVINYANRDTIIRTNSKDNIRIWGYHTGGGRAIVRYNLDDAGTLSSHSDSPLISPLFYVSGTDGIKISNIAIVPGTVDDSIWQFTPMSFQTSENIEVSACSTICAGFSSRGMYSPSGTSSYNFWIHDNYFGTISKGYNRRDAMYGTMIHLEGGFKSATGYQYLAKVTHNNINTIHTGVGITGGSNYPVVYLDSNTITVDARDDLHMTYDDNDGNNSAGDPYGINIGGCDSLSHIIGNTFASGSSYYGGDGMILQNVNASKTDRMEVYNNVMNLHHGPHPRIAAGRQAVVGVYARVLVRGLHYHNNLGYLIVDEDGATNSYGIYGEGARITMTDSGSSYNLIENNHYSVVAKDSVSRTGAGTFKVSGLSFIQVDSLIAGHHDVKENLSTNNYWRSPRTPIWGGCTRAQGFNNALISKDTVYTIYDGDSTFFSFEQLGTYDGHSVGNALQDMILLGYANQSDVYKGTISSNADSLGKQLSYLRSLTVNFKNASSANINGGTIWAVDAYGHRHDMPNSNASGNSSDTLRWRFFGYDALTGDGYAVQDSNAYNNFTFWGKSGSDSASTAATINWTTSQLINVQLSETTPPAAIKTLRGLTLKGVTIK